MLDLNSISVSGWGFLIQFCDNVLMEHKYMHLRWNILYNKVAAEVTFCSVESRWVLLGVTYCLAKHSMCELRLN
jgi:hypothetical protein